MSRAWLKNSASVAVLVASITTLGCWNRVIQPRRMRPRGPVIRQPFLPPNQVTPNPIREPLKAPTDFDQIENVPADSILRNR